VTGAKLLRALRRGDRRALARAITLVESSRPDHRDEAERVIEALLPETGKAVRIGISGPPGAGKSTFIERFGLAGIGLGRRIAVLAVDPTSKRGGGAILGDKTRMAELARAPEAFIRPSSAGDSRGGIARRTREAILLCEAAGFDAILVETIGVGQAETAVAEIVDMFVLLVGDGSGISAAVGAGGGLPASERLAVLATAVASRSSKASNGATASAKAGKAAPRATKVVPSATKAAPSAGKVAPMATRAVAPAKSSNGAVVVAKPKSSNGAAAAQVVVAKSPRGATSPSGRTTADDRSVTNRSRSKRPSVRASDF